MLESLLTVFVAFFGVIPAGPPIGSAPLRAVAPVWAGLLGATPPPGAAAGPGEAGRSPSPGPASPPAGAATAATVAGTAAATASTMASASAAAAAAATAGTGARPGVPPVAMAAVAPAPQPAVSARELHARVAPAVVALLVS